MTFSALWTTLVLPRTPPYHYGTTAAVRSDCSGHPARRRRPSWPDVGSGMAPNVRFVAIVSTLVGYVALLLWPSPRRAHRRIALIDVGVQSGHVANQSRIYSLVPDTRSRINTFYMVAFSSAALGSYFGPLGFNFGGWPGFCAIPLAALVFALGYFMRAERNRRSADDSTMRLRRSG